MIDCPSIPITFYQRLLPAEGHGPHPVAAELARRGWRVDTCEDGEFGADATRVLWVQGNTRWFPRLCQQLMRTPAGLRPPVLHWFHEPLPMPRVSGIRPPLLGIRELAKIVLRDRRTNDAYSNFRQLRRLASSALPDVLVVSTRARQSFLAEQGLRADWVPLGFDRRDLAPEADRRDIDVLYLGVATGRRRRQLAWLRRRGVPLQVMGSWHDPGLWGSERARLLSRARIFLNVSHYAGELPGARFILGMVNRALVVSEPVYRPEPFVPGRHFVSCETEKLPEVIDYYLHHPLEAQQIVAAAHRLVTEELTLSRSVSRIIEIAMTRIPLCTGSTPKR